jgi:hypothetical protein
MLLKSKSFKAPLEKFSGKGLNWVIVRLPFSVEKLWGTRGMLKVQVEVNGFDYRTSLFPTGAGEHYLMINKKMQKGASIVPGSVAKFTLTPDLAPRVLKLPAELEREFRQEPALRQWFDKLSYSVRKWLSDLVSDAKNAETRRTRAERVAEQIMEAMEAEHEFPPMIKLAFQRNPGAEEGWKRMTDTQRRQNLLAVFYYRTPQSRMKRLEKVIAEAMKHAR